MRFQVGDLVTATGPDKMSLGIVVKVGKANSSSLLSSKHSASLLNNSQDIYYIFAGDGAISGPYYTSELTPWN